MSIQKLRSLQETVSFASLRIFKSAKTALHRTRLPFSYQRIFSVLIFYKSFLQAAPLLAFSGKKQTEKYELNFSFFQFPGAGMERLKHLSD